MRSILGTSRALSVFACFFLFADFTRAEDSLPKWKFTPGETREYVREMIGVQKSKGIGITVDARMTVVCDIAVTGKSWDAVAGTGEVRLSFRRLQFKIEATDSNISFDSEKDFKEVDVEPEQMIAIFKALKGVDLICEIDERGNVKRTEFPEKVEAKIKQYLRPGLELAASRDMVMDMISPFGIVWPAKEDAGKQEWQNAVTRGDNVSSHTCTTTYKRAGTESINGEALEKYELKGAAKVEAKSTIEVEIKSYEGSGRVLFDREKGCLREMKFEETERGAMHLPGGVTDDYSETKTSIRLK